MEFLPMPKTLDVTRDGSQRGGVPTQVRAVKEAWEGQGGAQPNE